MAQGARDAAARRTWAKADPYLAGWALPGRCARCHAPVELRLAPRIGWVEPGTTRAHRCEEVAA